MTTARNVITQALRKLNAVRANQPPNAEQVQTGLETLNTLIDSKSDQLLNTHIITPYRFQLVAGQLAYELGPTGDWVTTRPMRIEKAKLMLEPTIVTCNVPTFSVSPNPAAFGELVTFTDLTNSQGPSTYSWDFGDGNTSIEQNPTHTYAGVGTFDVTLTVVNAACTSTSDPVSVQSLSPVWNLVWEGYPDGGTFTILNNTFTELISSWGNFHISQIPVTSGVAPELDHAIVYTYSTTPLSGPSVPSNYYHEMMGYPNQGNPMLEGPNISPGIPSTLTPGNNGVFTSAGGDRGFFYDTRVTISAAVDGYGAQNVIIMDIVPIGSTIPSGSTSAQVTLYPGALP